MKSQLIPLTVFFLCCTPFTQAFAEEGPSSYQSEDLTIDLKDPIFQKGIVKTQQGGVIEGQGIRIQADHIEYVNRVENGTYVKKVEASGNLMLVFKDKPFVGQKLVYDFTNGTGSIEEGRTYVDFWYLGGSKIELKEDGSFEIQEAFLTTSASKDNAWEIRSSKVLVNKQRTLSAKNINFRFFKVPFFWLPAFKSSVQFFKSPPIKYKVVWDKGLGPRASMRYKVASWQNLDLFFRLDYRITRGPGLAFESEYNDPMKQTTFITRSYGAYDKEVSAERNPKRYRLQGLYKKVSDDEKSLIYASYDKLSDIRMISDFKTDDFVVNTEKRTRLIFAHQEEDAFTRLSVQPRLNSFQSISQELPKVIAGIRPVELSNTGVITVNKASFSYMDYSYARDLSPYLQDYHALRLETKNSLYRPFHISNFAITPQAGVIGIFYNNSPQKNSVGQALFHYSLHSNFRIYRDFAKFRHVIQPVANFDGYSKPKSGLNNHYYFDIQDGYSRLEMLKIGVKNHFYSFKGSFFQPSLSSELYTIGFFNDFTYKKSFPKIYHNLEWNRPSYLISTGVCWNLEENVWDVLNANSLVTINENLALGLEFRHRSRFDWRKGNHENFFLDVSRPINELVDSPISDGRNTLLTKVQARLSPRLTCHLITHHGWGRKDEPRYNSAKVELTTLLTGYWRMKLGFQHSPNNDRFIFNIFLAN